MKNPFLGPGAEEVRRRLPDAPIDTLLDYIVDSWAKAIGVAPCIAEPTFDEAARGEEVIAVLRAIIMRWHDAQSGAVVNAVAGPYQVQFDNRPRRGYTLLISEILDLQRICRGESAAFVIDTEGYDDTGPREGKGHGIVANGRYWG